MLHDSARSARHFAAAPTTVETFADLFDATFVLELGERVAALALPARQPRSEDFEVALGHPVPELTFDAVKQLGEADRFTTRFQYPEYRGSHGALRQMVPGRGSPMHDHIA